MPAQTLPSGLKKYLSPRTEEEALVNSNTELLDAVLQDLDDLREEAALLDGLTSTAAQIDAAVAIVPTTAGTPSATKALTLDSYRNVTLGTKDAIKVPLPPLSQTDKNNLLKYLTLPRLSMTGFVMRVRHADGTITDTTDQGTEADNGAAFRTAVTAAGSYVAGDVVYLASGTLDISAGGAMTYAAGVTVIGTGMDKTIIRNSANALPNPTHVLSANCTFYDLHMQSTNTGTDLLYMLRQSGNTITTTFVGVKVTGTTDVFYHTSRSGCTVNAYGCWFQSSWDLIRSGATSTYNCWDCTWYAAISVTSAWNTHSEIQKPNGIAVEGANGSFNFYRNHFIVDGTGAEATFAALKHGAIEDTSNTSTNCVANFYSCTSSIIGYALGSDIEGINDAITFNFYDHTGSGAAGALTRGTITGTVNEYTSKVATPSYNAAALLALQTDTVQTTLTGAAGTAVCSMPDRGATKKTVIIYLNGFTDHETPANNTYTYPTPFTYAPTVLGDATAMGVTATVSDVTKCVLSGASTDTGVIILEGY
jgi:hypothetical protein